MQRGQQTVVVSVVVTFIALCVVALRFYCRCVLLKRAGADDYSCAAALAFSMMLTICVGLQQKYGLGRHFDTIVLEDFQQMCKYLWISIIVYALGLIAIKGSVIAQLLRFIIHSRLRPFCWGLLGLSTSYGVVAVIISIMSCRPVSYFWNRGIPGGRCINLLAFWYTVAAFNIVTDVIVLGIPISLFRSMTLPKRQKLGLILVYALGGFVCVTSILRLHSIYIISVSSDVTWDNVGAAAWSAVELNTGIICACLPTLMPLIKKVSPSLLSSQRKSEMVPLQDSA